MKVLRFLVPGLLLAYSAALIACELSTSQDYVRYYFSDIDGPRPFFAANTTVSVAFLWATALLFAVTVACLGDEAEERRARLFFISQVLVFGFMGLDDRFKVHEGLALRLGTHDHYILLVPALAQVVLVLWLGRDYVFKHRARGYFFLGVGLFGAMFVVDAFADHDAVLRLTIEDLAKTWSGFCFFLWAWCHFQDRVGHLRKAAGVAADEG